MKKEELKKYLEKVQGKTIAVVYIFEGETAVGYEHYDIWKSDVISEWILAIQEIKCIPLIFDARSFIEKAISKTLPPIDAVLNLNNGNIELSTLSLIPSVCSFEHIPCIPCNAVSIISGENKLFSNLIANSIGLNVPQNYKGIEEGIFRSMNFGSSRGTYKTTDIKENDFGFSQEFIKGYDITTPLLYNPITCDLEVLPSIMYYPENKDVNWFFNEEVKENRCGYKKRILYVDNKTINYYKKMAKTLQINTFCRIDSRIACENSSEWDSLFAEAIPYEKIKFIEINPMPTLKQNINFHNCIDAITEKSSFYEFYNAYSDFYNKCFSKTAFILFCSLISLL